MNADVSGATPKELTIDRLDIEEAFRPWRDPALTTPNHFLDCKTGEVLWLYEEDATYELITGEPAEQNAAVHASINAERERYLWIKPLENDDFQQMLRDFLDTEWTRDANQRMNAIDAYTGAIGRWKRHVGDIEAIHAFQRYESEQTMKLGEEFLRANGINPVWE